MITPTLAELAELPAKVKALEAEIQLLRQLIEKAPANDTLLDAVQAGAYLSMTPEAVRQAARRGSIPYVKIGARLRFKSSDLEKIQR